MTLDPHYETAHVVLYAGDCLDVLRQLPPNSVDSVVTDPPAAIGFMQKSWDSDKGGREQWSAWLADVMREAYRVAKPGAHALVWALPRTSHWTACGIEDAGWVIRDRVHHLFGSGFPKSLDVGKAIDKRPGVARHAEFARHLAERRTKAGLSRADVAERVVGARTGACWNWEHHQFPEARWWPALRDLLGLDDVWGPVIAQADREVIAATPLTYGYQRSGERWEKGYDVTAPATDAARQWSGWGTALKPSAEDWWLARKPLSEGTVAGNVLKWGTGAINVDRCRVGTTDNLNGGAYNGDKRQRAEYSSTDTENGAVPLSRLNRGIGEYQQPQGRWPAHTLITHDARDGEQCVAECPAAVMDGQSGNRPGAASQAHVTKSVNSVYQEGVGCVLGEYQGFNDSGGASRFFPQFRWSPGDDPAPFLYTAKAASAERPRVRRDGAGNGRVTGLGGKVRQCNVCETRAIESGAKEPSCGHGDYRWEKPTSNSAAIVAHPTVKPLELMRWLVRLITPPGGTCLDMFAGSGTTGEAALQEGMRAVLIEREPDYLPLIVQRLTRQRDPVAHAKATGTEGEALW